MGTPPQNTLMLRETALEGTEGRNMECALRSWENFLSGSRKTARKSLMLSSFPDAYFARKCRNKTVFLLLYTYVCTHACKYECMHVCKHVGMCVCIAVWMYACMCVCMRVCMYICIHVCMHYTSKL